MKKNKLGILIIILVLGMAVIGCKDGSTGNTPPSPNNDAGPYAGSWTGTWTYTFISTADMDGIITISSSGWTLRYVQLSESSDPIFITHGTGSFHRTGNSFVLYSENIQIGTGTVSGDDILTVVLNESVGFIHGTHTATRNDFVGNWKGTHEEVGDINGILVCDKWYITIPDISFNHTGTYEIIDSTTLSIKSDIDEVIGTAELSGNTLTITITEVGGTLDEGTILELTRS